MKVESFLNDKGLIEGKEVPFPFFSGNPPDVLYIDLIGNKGYETESYKPVWNKYSNSLNYLKNGRQGAKGFTLIKAYKMYLKGELTTLPYDEIKLKKENYEKEPEVHVEGNEETFNTGQEKEISESKTENSDISIEMRPVEEKKEVKCFASYLSSIGFNIEKDSHFFGETATIIDLDTKQKFRVIKVEEEKICLKPIPSFSGQGEQAEFYVTYPEIFEKFRSGSIQVEGFTNDEEKEFARVLLNIQKQHKIDNLSNEISSLKIPPAPVVSIELEPKEVIITNEDKAISYLKTLDWKEDINALGTLLSLEEDPKEKKQLKKKIKQLEKSL